MFGTTGTIQVLTTDLDGNLAQFREGFGEADDVRFHRFRLGGMGVSAALVYIESLVDLAALRRHALEPLLLDASLGGADGAQGGGSGQALAEWIARSVQSAGSVTAVRQVREAVDEVLAGHALLLLDGADTGLLLRVRGPQLRPVDEPTTETVLRGPRDGFVEEIGTNVAAVRRRIQHAGLRVSTSRLGERTRTRVAMLHVDGLAHPDVVQAVRERLQRIRIDGVLDSSQVEENITGRHRSPFPLVHLTERPDVVARALLSGKVAVVVDGTPWALIAPARLIEFFFAADDYYLKPAAVLLVRTARIMAWLGVVFFPALYVALEAYNPEVFRIELLMAIDAARAGVPLSVLLEIAFLEIMMELIQEATIRLPSKIGAAATVVGGLIIGDAVSRARIVSNPVIVIAAMAAIGSFAFPNREIAAAWRMTKIALLAGAALLGLLGVFLAFFVVVVYLNSLESFGVPYLEPLAPLKWRDLVRDGLTRPPWWKADVGAGLRAASRRS